MDNDSEKQLHEAFGFFEQAKTYLMEQFVSYLKSHDLDRMAEVADKSYYASVIGRVGGLKGGKARAAKLSKEQRSAIARKAAKARWRN